MWVCNKNYPIARLKKREDDVDTGKSLGKPIHTDTDNQRNTQKKSEQFFSFSFEFRFRGCLVYKIKVNWIPSAHQIDTVFMYYNSWVSAVFYPPISA